MKWYHFIPILGLYHVRKVHTWAFDDRGSDEITANLGLAWIVSHTMFLILLLGYLVFIN